MHLLNYIVVWRLFLLTLRKICAQKMHTHVIVWQWKGVLGHHECVLQYSYSPTQADQAKVWKVHSSLLESNNKFSDVWLIHSFFLTSSFDSRRYFLVATLHKKIFEKSSAEYSGHVCEHISGVDLISTVMYVRYWDMHDVRQLCQHYAPCIACTRHARKCHTIADDILQTRQITAFFICFVED